MNENHDNLPVFDEHALREITSAAGMAPMELLELFIDDAQSNLALLEQSLATGDREVFCRAAHSLKSSAGNVGALRFSALSQRLEHGSKQALGAEMAPLVEQLRADYNELLAVIETRKESLLF